ncbi:MAG: AAA family ATPase, partial [Actinomycetota bacterium]
MGREREIGVILEEVGRRGSCYISGSAGIGKSMVLREVRRRLLEAGADVLSISGMEATALVPLAPLLRLCPPGADDAGAAIIAELYRRSRSSEVVVIVDDAHLLDDATAAIVRQLATADILGLVVAHRDGEAVPPPIRSIREEDLGRHVEISPLDRRSIAQLAEHLLGATEPRTLDWIWQHSQGNPLYTRELILAGVQTGALQEKAGRWIAVDAPVWTSRLHALVARRLAGLTPEERGCLQLVAVAGRLPVGILGELSGLETVFEMERRGLLLVDGQTAEMGHPLYGTAVLATMSDARTRDASLHIAAALEASGEHDDPVVVASLRLDAGEELDAATLVSALQAARCNRLPERAERFSRRLLEGRDDPEVRMCLCEALGVQRRWEEAGKELDAVLAASPPQEHAGLLERWAHLNFEFREDLSTTRAIIEDVASRLGEG